MFGLSNFIITEFLLIFYSLVTNVLYSYIICEKGLVLKRRPFSVKEYFHSLFHGDEYFVFVDYEHIIGFTEGWRELQAMNGHGGIYVIPLDLAQVGYKDKMAMIEAIHKHSDT